MSLTYQDGRYVAEEPPLHDSDYSVIYHASDHAPHVALENQLVILKVLKSRPDALNDHAATMFHREVSALEKLQHPGIVRMLNHFQDHEKKQLCIVLEYFADARSLTGFIQTEPAPPLAERLRMLLDLLSAIDYAHGENIVHRDINPSNVLVSSDGSVKLVDFGISHLKTALKRQPVGTVRRFHTPPFAPIEQHQNGEISTGCDWYAFGVLIATTLAWTYPGDDFEPSDIVKFAGPFQGALRNQEVSRQLAQLLLELVTKPTFERPKAQEIERVLREALNCVQRREILNVTLGAQAKQDLATSHLELSWVLADLNEQPRAQLSLRRQGEEETYQVILYGSCCRAILTPARDPQKLQLTRIWDNRSDLERHERTRSEALEIFFSFGISHTGSDASNLLDILQREATRVSEERKEKARREGFLAVASAVLEFQRLQAGRLEVPYRLPGLLDHHASRTVKAGTLVEVELLTEEWDRQDDGILGGWEGQGLAEAERYFDSESGERSQVIMEGSNVSFASIHAYHPARRRLTLRVTRTFRLRAEGVLICVDAAMLAPIERQEEALRRFVRDTGEHKGLAELITNPARNSLDPKRNRDMLQPVLQADPHMVNLVERALSARDFFLIQGPPGTGKTTVITEIMAQILKEDPHARILLTSQANEAVNNALDRLQRLGRELGETWRLQRDWSGDEEKGGGFRSLDDEFSLWLSTLREVTLERAQRYEPQPGENPEAVRAALAEWHAKLTPTRTMKRAFASGVRVFGATCLRVPVLTRRIPHKFDWIIFDEAAKATPAEVITALVTGKRFILVGDQKQLPPFLDRETEESLRAAGLNAEEARTSLFERLLGDLEASNKGRLSRQYRMHPTIGDMVGKLYYADDGGLEAGRGENDFPLAWPTAGTHRVSWLDVSRGNETRSGASWRNIKEAQAILQWLKQADAAASQAEVRYSVAVIAAYAAQKQLLRQMLLTLNWEALDLQVDTVDAFQGKEADIVLYSVVRTSRGEQRFINDRRRLNVAFSRARRQLIIVGRSAALKGGPEFSKVFAYLPAACLIREQQ